MTDKEKNKEYIWWAAPVTILMFTLWFILMLIGVPMSIAIGIHIVFVVVFWFIYTYNYDRQRKAISRKS